MTESKVLHLKAEEDFVLKLDDIDKMLDSAQSNLNNPKHITEQQANNASLWIQKCKNSVSTAKQNLDSVSDILNTRKASLELKEIAVRSWPRSTFIDRLTWIATALFPAGGISFVFAGGLTDESLMTAIAFWLVGAIALIMSVVALKKEDDRKWRYFEYEFGIDKKGGNPSSTGSKAKR